MSKTYFLSCVISLCIGISHAASISWDGTSADITGLTATIKSTPNVWDASDEVWNTTDEVIAEVGSQAAFKSAISQAGTVHNSMVNHVDLAPTLLDFAGLPIPDDMQGYSLKPILKGSADKVRDASYYHFYNHGKRLPEMIGIRTATYKLIHYPEMDQPYQWELFDLKEDPDEMENLCRDPKHKEIMERMKKELKGLIRTLDDPVEAPDLMKI